MVLVGRSGSFVLCTAGLEDMAVALSPGQCGSYRQILSNKSVSRCVGFDAESIKHER